MVVIAFLLGLVMIAAFASAMVFFVTVLMRKVLRMQLGKWFWWIASVIAAVFSGLLFALFVLAFADAAFSPLGAFLIYLCMSWVCGLPALLIMRRNWRRQQLPDPVAIFE